VREGDEKLNMAYGLQTYDDSARREDLIDVIGDVSPDNNPLMTLLATTSASGTYHEWLEDYISRPTSISKAVEGAAATYSDLTQPSRRGNFTNIITTTYRVSGTERAVNVAGMGDPFDYQSAKALREWKNQAEYNLINATGLSGSSGVAREMVGIEAVVTSHYTNLLSGTSLSESDFNDMVDGVWSDVGADDVFDMVLVPFKLRQKISTFTAGSTKYVDARDRRLTRPVMVYESDGGVHRIFAHKDVRSAVATPGPTMFGLKEDKWRIAYLRKPFRELLAKDGDRDNGQIVGEFTIEYLAERANARRSGYAQGG
jgi:hypothetical protein